jgi:hypothetical protein
VFRILHEFNFIKHFVHFERNDSNSERNIMKQDQMLHEKKSQSMPQTSLLSYFNKFPQPCKLQQPEPRLVSSHQH